MPLYEYQCKQCHRRTEKIQKFSDPELTTCPHCGGELERTVTAPAVHFAGSGWYKDLYSSAKPPAPNASGDAPAATPNTGDKPSAGAGESKSAADAPAPAPGSPAPAPSSTTTTS